MNCGICGNCREHVLDGIKTIQIDVKDPRSATRTKTSKGACKPVSISDALQEVFDNDEANDSLSRSSEDELFCFPCAQSLSIVHKLKNLLQVGNHNNMSFDLMLERLNKFLSCRNRKRHFDVSTQTIQVSNPYVKLRDCFSTLHPPAPNLRPKTKHQTKPSVNAKNNTIPQFLDIKPIGIPETVFHSEVEEISNVDVFLHHKDPLADLGDFIESTTTDDGLNIVKLENVDVTCDEPAYVFISSSNHNEDNGAEDMMEEDQSLDEEEEIPKAKKSKSCLFSNFNCTDCQQLFSSLSELNEHIFENHGTREECPTCFITFKSKTNMEIHILNVHRDHSLLERASLNKLHKSVYCAQCDIWMFSTFKLRRHNFQLHNPSRMSENRERMQDSLNNCSKCNGTFRLYNPYSTHYSKCKGVWEDEQTTICNVCNITVREKHLHRHIEEHEFMLQHPTYSDLFPVFGESSSSFSTNTSNYVKKRNNGSNSNPSNEVNCPKCNEQFQKTISMRTLRTHMRFCTGEEHLRNPEKIIHCHECGEKLVIDLFIKHTTEHAVEMVFVCDLCGDTFKRRYNLKRHLETVHRGGKISKKRSKLVPIE